MPPVKAKAKANPWPEHWHNGRASIKCIVSGCDFTTHRLSPHSQWNDLQDHCSEASGAEHAILLKMLWQTTCVIGNCDRGPFLGDPASRARNLFAHEQQAHHSTKLSTIPDFVRLARDDMIPGSLWREAQKHIFDRLVEKMVLKGKGVLRELCERSGYRRRSLHTYPVLKSILKSDHESLSGGYVPYSVPPSRFLWVARPDPDDPGEYGWLLEWTQLRDEYFAGII